MASKEYSDAARAFLVSLGGLFIGLCVLAAYAALLQPLPQSGQSDSLRPDYLVPAAFGDDARPGAMSADEQQAIPLFGMATEPVFGEVAAKWRAVKADIYREEGVLARCRAQLICPAAAQTLLDIVAEGAHHTGRVRVGRINRAVNLAIRPSSDEEQWGVEDRWSTPFETLQSRRGDCEDFAIVKYVALLEAGLPRDDVKMVILRNLFPYEDHAAVAARIDGQWIILDNRRLALVRDSDMVRSIPRFVLDENGVRRFVRSHPAGQRPSAALSIVRAGLASS
jgi:predicted transglutaminase-like cysteine proteinase